MRRQGSLFSPFGNFRLWVANKWQLMRPAISPSPRGVHEEVVLTGWQDNNLAVGELAELIRKTFGSFLEFKTNFEKNLRIGNNGFWAISC